MKTLLPKRPLRVLISSGRWLASVVAAGYFLLMITEAYWTVPGRRVASNLLVLCTLLFLLLPMILRSRLRSRGYGWIGYNDAVRLGSAYGHHVWELPPREDLAVLPGYRDDLGGLELILNRISRRYFGKHIDHVPELRAYWNTHFRLPPAEPRQGLVAFLLRLPVIVYLAAMPAALVSIPLVATWDDSPTSDVLGYHLAGYMALLMLLLFVAKAVLDQLYRRHLRALGYHAVANGPLDAVDSQYVCAAELLPPLASMRQIMGPDWTPDAHELRLCMETLKVMEKLDTADAPR